MPSIAARICATRQMRWLDQVNKRKDQNPDEVHKVPVQPGDLNRISVFDRIRSAQGADKQTQQIDHPTRHVHAVEARQDKECGAEQRRGVRKVMGWMSDAWQPRKISPPKMVNPRNLRSPA